eukprot:jgi/Mesvir1/20580/Mv14821-RA.1
MSAHPSQEVTLEQVMAVPGIGVQVMAALPVSDQVRLRPTCRAFRDAADESLSHVTELYGEDVAGDGSRPGVTGLSWLLTKKCPRLTALSVDTRANCELPWADRDRWAVSWPRGKSHRISFGVLEVEEIARGCTGLKHLNVASCWGVSSYDLRVLARSLHELETLDVSNCKIDDDGIMSIAESCPKLRQLSASNCPHVTDESLTSLAQHCRQLVAVDIAKTRVTDAGVTVLVRSVGASLCSLVLPRRVTDASVSLIADHCPHLRTLVLQEGRRVTSASVKRIAAGCPRLERLDVPCLAFDEVYEGFGIPLGEALSKEDISALVVGCPGLRRLNLSRTGLSDASVRTIAEHCPRLEHLDVSDCEGVSDAGIRAVAVGCRDLRHLAVAGCLRIKDAAIRLVAQQCPRLQALVITRTVVGDVGLLAVGASCHELSRLEMERCARVRGPGLTAVAEGCPRLEHLDISFASVSRNSLMAVSQRCARLRTLRADSVRIAQVTLMKMVEEMGSRLRVLSLVDNWDITDKAVVLLARKCPGLKSLVVSGSQISDRGIQALRNGCKGLQRLTMDSCPKVTSAGVRSLDLDRCCVEYDDDDRNALSASSDDESEDGVGWGVDWGDEDEDDDDYGEEEDSNVEADFAASVMELMMAVAARQAGRGR